VESGSRSGPTRFIHAAFGRAPCPWNSGDRLRAWGSLWRVSGSAEPPASRTARDPIAGVADMGIRGTIRTLACGLRGAAIACRVLAGTARAGSRIEEDSHGRKDPSQR